MIAVIIGPPGAGKGTQADLLSKQLGYRKISTGDLLREHIKKKTELGKLVEGIMALGQLVDDDVLFRIIDDALGHNSKEKVLLDGFPRNVAQAKGLATISPDHPVRAVLHLDVKPEVLQRRLQGRLVCQDCGRSYHVENHPPAKAGVCDACQGKLVKRPDDDVGKFMVRYNVYEKETKPVLDFYRAEGLYKRVDGSQDFQQVYNQLRDILGGL